MKPIAENHITITRKLFTEGSMATKNKDYQKIILKFGVSITLFCITIGIWFIYTGKNLIHLIGELIFIAALLLWIIFILPRSGNRSRYKAMCQSLQEPPVRTISFFQDYLLVLPKVGKEISIPYKNVLGWTETKNLWILNCENNLGVMLKKDGFSTGTIELVKDAIAQGKETLP